MSYNPGGKCHRALLLIEAAGALDGMEIRWAMGGDAQAQKAIGFLLRAMAKHDLITSRHPQGWYALTPKGEAVRKRLDAGEDVLTLAEELRQAALAAEPSVRMFHKAAA